MKSRLYILWVVLAFSLSNTAIAQDFNTGSQLMNTGSSYSSQVYGVGATAVDPVYGSTGSTRRSMLTTDDPWGPGAEGGEGDKGSPIGAPYIMLLFAAAAAGVIALRRRRATNS